MAQIISLFNGGKRSRKTGVVNVNSKNVYPVTLTAVPSPGASTITLALLESFEFFTGVRTSAATDLLVIPAGAPVGTEIIINATNSFGVIRAGSETINGVSTIVTITAGGTAKLLKVTSTAWILTNYATNGAVTAPVV